MSAAPLETQVQPQRRALHEFLAKHQRFLLTTHLNPDGDAIGSEVAFARWLRSLGKTVRILNDSLTPHVFTFLTRENPVEVWDAELAEKRFAEADALIVLDTSNRQRIGRLSALIDRHAIAVAVVDHHTSHSNGFGNVNVIEPETAATGELIYELMRESNSPIDPLTAEAIYVAVMTDTGGFRYSNTDSHVHRMVADLLTLGLDPNELHAKVHSNASAGRIRFFGEVLAGLEMLQGGQLAVLEATPEQFQKHGLVGADTEGLVDMPRSVAGVEAVALFSEVEPGKVKVSLRSTGRVAIDQVCSQLGGGGHPHAAGVLLRGTREQARARILPELTRLLEALPPEESTR